jgi:hypothetical protein
MTTPPTVTARRWPPSLAVLRIYRDTPVALDPTLLHRERRREGGTVYVGAEIAEQIRRASE